eukprot:758328-Lingulodinium_polyedra.AAC.1
MPLALALDFAVQDHPLLHLPDLLDAILDYLSLPPGLESLPAKLRQPGEDGVLRQPRRSHFCHFLHQGSGEWALLHQLAQEGAVGCNRGSLQPDPMVMPELLQASLCILWVGAAQEWKQAWPEVGVPGHAAQPAPEQAQDQPEGLTCQQVVLLQHPGLQVSSSASLEGPHLCEETNVVQTGHVQQQGANLAQRLQEGALGMAEVVGKHPFWAPGRHSCIGVPVEQGATEDINESHHGLHPLEGESSTGRVERVLGGPPELLH